MGTNDPLQQLRSRAAAAIARRGIKAALREELEADGKTAFRLRDDRGSVFTGHVDETPRMTIQRLVDDLESG